MTFKHLSTPPTDLDVDIYRFSQKINANILYMKSLENEILSDMLHILTTNAPIVSKNIIQMMQN